MITAYPDYTEDERLQVLREQASGESPEDMAVHLAYQRALATVNSILKREYSKLPTIPPRAPFHRFAVQMPKANPHDYQVFEVEADAVERFAKLHKVSVKDLMQIASGAVEEIKGIRQSEPMVGTLDVSRHDRLHKEWEKNRLVGNQSSLPAEAVRGPVYGFMAKPIDHNDKGPKGTPVMHWPAVRFE
jgi:hypothetical protein